ncbi:TonB family protein [Erythrobacter sp. SCSIO 43205]|uniref:TonB family protein n=1 Tax=Erythrobacter sp. SCSIO 43205 TaxID=2779361 RepID=UPI001CA818DE|nr:TonB family protein [Erythrobacter sp. SCSIO 43205]UAB78173.1 TonB family protein [Erythrobacter sp. SCSIO 43205]
MNSLRLALTVCTASMVAVIGASSPASALQRGAQVDAQRSTEVFVDLGRWVILQNEAQRSCELRLNDGGPHILRYQMKDGQGATLSLEPRSGRYFGGMIGNVEWAFDEARFAGFGSGGGFSLGASSRDVVAGFRAARVLSVSQGGQPIARIDLTTSSAGYRLLEQCAEQWRYIPWYQREAYAQYRELPEAAPSRRGRMIAGPSRPEPRSGSAGNVRGRPGGVAPPLRPATDARPINSSDWIRADDRLPWPSRGFAPGQGVLRYTLLVNENGRAEDCDVEDSTGSRKLDRRACKLLEERARFEPARTATGQAVKARYTSTVKFAGD